ncbi:hypothetical protein [Mycobacterium sp. MS1601]|uniref:hypothetical protein n=1 Tax=Mycobacterium sp. MS1601 TaxID=1936029 RepID=UPI001F4309ED|nr:hypothetical protein [Mycobacterium sp. MS1601]
MALLRVKIAVSRALQLLGEAGGAAVFAPALAACRSSSSGNALAGNAPLSGKFEGVTLKLLVNQPHVTSFRDGRLQETRDRRQLPDG